MTNVTLILFFVTFPPIRKHLQPNLRVSIISVSHFEENRPRHSWKSPNARMSSNTSPGCSPFQSRKKPRDTCPRRTEARNREKLWKSRGALRSTLFGPTLHGRFFCGRSPRAETFLEQQVWSGAPTNVRPTRPQFIRHLPSPGALRKSAPVLAAQLSRPVKELLC